MFSSIKLPHVFPLLTIVILVASVFTYIIPSGNYKREELQIGQLTRTVVIPGSFEEIPKNYSFKGFLFGETIEGKATPVGVLGFLSAIPKGLEQSADIVFFVFLIGGVFGIIKRTGTITAVIQKLIDKFSNSGPTLTIVLMLIISACGSTLGMAEEFIPLIPVFLYVSHKLGYDKIYGVALVFVSAEIGFASATTNPFNVQIAQGIAEVPLGSGIGFRLIFYGVIMFATIMYMLRYGKKLKQDPSNSYLDKDNTYKEDKTLTYFELNNTHIKIVVVSSILFIGILYAVQTMGWWMAEMGAGFLLIGFVAAFIGK